MLYKEKYHIKTRFQRSANISSDENLLDFLDNYLVTPSATNTIGNILNGIKYGQGAFTLTGAYGGGKSSLCLFLMTILGSDAKVRNKAINKISKEQSDDIKKLLKSLKGNFYNIPITAREDTPVNILAEALKCDAKPDEILKKIGNLRKKHQRVNIIIDEMGKILEGSHDPFFLQTLAEYCNRSNGEVNFIGCLHVAFSEYARGKAKHIAEEWRKIQGRFLDIPVNTFQEEQIMLIGSAIESQNKSTPSEAIEKFIKLKTGKNPKDDKTEEKLLKPTYPLHPATVLMLAKYANSEISQSNRSIFTFLSSPERYGFQEFLATEAISKNNLYTPDKLYDYITANLRNAIIGTEVVSTFATAQEILKNLDDITAETIIKTITLWQLLEPHNKIKMSAQTLKAIYSKDLSKTLKYLEEAQHIRTDRRYGYIVSETSDFDLLDAKKNVQSEYSSQELRSLAKPRYVNTVIGKKHLFKTGTIRSMDIIIAHTAHLEDISSSEKRPDKISDFILILPRDADEEQKAKKLLKKSNSNDNFYSIIKNYEAICKVNSEIHILEKINNDNPILKYNKVAKNIIESLIESEKEILEQEISIALSEAVWFHKGEKIGELGTKDYSQECSALADRIFNKSPIIHSELLNKNRIDSGAASGLRKLLMAMPANADEERLGFKGYSAEASLYDILLGNSNIHDSSRTGNPYSTPKGGEDKSNVCHLWNKTVSSLTNENGIVSLQDIYDKIWSKPPYGVKEGLHSVLALAYILANSKNIAKYIRVEKYEFHTELDEFFCETLLLRPQDIGLRYITEEQKSNKHIKALYKIAREVDDIPSPKQNEILDIAASYKQFINNLPVCTKTTDNLSIEARNFRNAIRNTEDPNKMINTDLKAACPAEKVPEVVKEISQYYANRLMHICSHIDKQLKITPKANGKLTKRSTDVQYYATDPDVRMLSKYIQIKNSQERTEKIIQMATGKYPEEWTDQVLNSSIVFINGHIDEFLRVERKINLQSDERALVCVRDDGEYREVEVSRDEVKKLVDSRRKGNG